MILKKVSFWIIVFSLILTIFVYIFWPENAYKANIIVNILSIGITAGLIDILVNIIPENKKRKTAKNILKENVNGLLFRIEELINTTLLVFKVKIKLEDITFDELNIKNNILNQLDGNIKYNDNIIVNKYSIYNIKTKKRIMGFINAPTKYGDFIKNEIYEIQEYIKKITPFKYFYENDPNFVEAITRLQFCNFINSYGKNNPCFIFTSTGKIFFEIIELYRKFVLLNYNTEYSICETMIGSEALNYEKNYRDKRKNYENDLDVKKRTFIKSEQYAIEL